jgi:hypothetical protein
VSWHVAGMLMTTVLLASPDGAMRAATVELREAVTIGADRITLGQLAEITPAERADRIGAIEVGPAPLPGDSRRLTRGYLKMRLRRGGVTDESVTFTGAETVEVRRELIPVAGGSEGGGGGVSCGAGASAQPPATVPRGALIRLTVVCGAVTVGAEATLLEDAAVGGRARMRVEQTRETVVAQIVHPGEAILRRE